MVTATRLEPPVNDPPLQPDGTTHSDAWRAHNQDMADALARVSKGVTDGSDAKAGEIGEYMTAISGAVSLATGGHTDVISLTLTAGDWDVWGSAVIGPSAANLTFAQAWLSQSAATPADPGRAGIQSGGTGTLGTVSLVVGPIRLLSGGAITVHLGCQANFPGGTSVSASANIQARRMR